MKLRVKMLRLFAPTCEAQRRLYRKGADEVQAHAEDIERHVDKVDLEELREELRKLINRSEGHLEVA